MFSLDGYLLFLYYLGGKAIVADPDPVFFLPLDPGSGS
jgi:hypothetical protein